MRVWIRVQCQNEQSSELVCLKNRGVEERHTSSLGLPPLFFPSISNFSDLSPCCLCYGEENRSKLLHLYLVEPLPGKPGSFGHIICEVIFFVFRVTFDSDSLFCMERHFICVLAELFLCTPYGFFLFFCLPFKLCIEFFCV